MGQLFGEFGEWLLAEVGSHKAALNVHRYLPLFLAIEGQWKDIPSYVELLRRFGAEGLRRFRLPMRWLHEAKGITPDPAARELDSEQRRIDAIMASVPMRSPGGDALAAYRDRLMRRVVEQKATLRSARLALRPAASLLVATELGGAVLPDQARLGNYLLHAPGQKAALSGFVTFLNKRYGLELTPTIDEERLQKERKRKLESELVRQMRESDAGQAVTRKWLSAALAYFHGFPKSTAARAAKDAAVVQQDDTGILVALGGRAYWLPRRRPAADDPAARN